MLDELRIFDAARSVTDALRLEHAKRFPHAVRSQRFAGMRGTEQALVPRIAIRSDVSVQREPSFVGSNVQRPRLGCPEIP